MKRYTLLLSLALTLLMLAGCEKPFDQLAQDPNRPTSAPASLILQGIENDMYNANRAPSGFNYVTDDPWGAEQRWNQFYASNYNYYATNDYAWTSTTLNYTTLKDVVRMETEAASTGQAAVNPYSALGKFFRAYFFENMTRRLGDIPMTDALKGLDNLTPKYDTQKAVYLQILSWLDSANDDLASLIAQKNNNLAGDIYMSNSLTQWQKVVNTFKMRVLISLSHRASDADLKVPARFAEVLSNPTKFPLMTSLADNMQYTYNAVYNQYPRNPSNFGNNATRENMADTYLGLLTKLKDPRTFVVAEPAGALVASGIKPTDFAAFRGASSGEDLATMASKANVGGYSFQNRKRYYSTYLGEPYFLIGYPELQFNIAEGINRGWVATGNAETYYQNGIKASWSFYGLTDGANTVYFSPDGGYQNFNTFTVNVSFADYYAQSGVKYAAGATGLMQILQQKYLAFAQNSGLEAFYNQRRTGVPTFEVGPGTGNSTRIPLRWQYPATERQYNGANNASAVTSQYGATGDDINAKMWLLQD